VASDLPKPVRLPEPKGYISVEQLIVLAPGRTEAIISGVTFSLAPGDGLGIIGPSGSGKSTLIRAIVGVWPVAKGSVRIDGATVQQWPPEQIGRAIGYVPQDVELFSGTVAENIARFEPNPDPELIVEAAKRANVHDLILRLPDGYRTDLGESGSKLSAGQRQRIALARALYGNPVLLVLDEPNSNLDSGGEQALAATIAEMRKRGVTVIIVAHRRSALAMVDRLLFLQDGRQVAFGPKDEVLRIATQSVAAAQASSKLVSVNPANLGPRPKSGTVAR
jgi:ATP-binding cassette subfamily C protein